MKKIFSRFLTILGLCGFATLSYGFDGTVTGQIGEVQGATSTSGYDGFAVWLKNNPALCGNSATSAYLLTTDANYKVNVSLLMAAKSLGSSITLYSNKDANGGCQLILFTFQ